MLQATCAGFQHPNSKAASSVLTCCYGHVHSLIRTVLHLGRNDHLTAFWALMLPGCIPPFSDALCRVPEFTPIESIWLTAASD